MLKELTHCVSRHQNLKSYSTALTSQKHGFALTSFSLVWGSYNPIWVSLWFPYRWKQINTECARTFKQLLLFLQPFFPLFPPSLGKHPHTLPCPVIQAVNYLIPRRRGKNENNVVSFFFPLSELTHVTKLKCSQSTAHQLCHMPLASLTSVLNWFS